MSWLIVNSDVDIGCRQDHEMKTKFVGILIWFGCIGVYTRRESVHIKGLKGSAEDITDSFWNIGKSLALISAPFIKYQEDNSYGQVSRVC